MSTEIGKTVKGDLVMETTDGYEVVMTQDPEVAVIAFNEIKDYMTQQGFVYMEDCKKRMSKWYKQKERMFAMIQTSMHHDPKVVAIASIRPNGAIWVHDIMPLCPVMEQPFRSWMIIWMEAMAKGNNKSIIIPKWLRESADFDAKDSITIGEANELFDKADVDMKETGENETVVTHMQKE